MTALALTIAGVAVILLWAAWTGESPLAIVREALGVGEEGDEGV